VCIDRLRAIRRLGWHIVIFSSMPDLDEMGAFPQIDADHAGVYHTMAVPN